MSNSFFIKVDPCGIEFAKMVVLCHGFGDIVAWEESLACVTTPQKLGVWRSHGVKLTHSYQKYRNDDDTSISLAVSSVFLRQGKVNKPSKDAHPPPKTPHVMPSTFYRAGGIAEPPSERLRDGEKE